MEFRNAEGYPDPTAYQAIINILRERKFTDMGIKRGDVYYVESIYDQSSSRPAVVVSTEEVNDADRYVTVVYLTTNPKTDLNTNVSIRSVGNGSVALCGCPASVPQERLGNFKGSVTEAEMASIEIGLVIALGLETPEPRTVEIIKEVPVYKEVPVPFPEPAQVEAEAKDLEEFRAKYDLLREMYGDLLSRVIGKEASA